MADTINPMGDRSLSVDGTESDNTESLGSTNLLSSRGGEDSSFASYTLSSPDKQIYDQDDQSNEEGERHGVLDNESAYRPPASAVDYKVYPMRWGILAMFCSLILANATMWVTFAPISNIAQDYFGPDIGSITNVNMLAIVFLVFYPVGTALEVYCMSKFKLRNTILIGGALTVAGSSLRLLAAYLQPSIGFSTLYALMFMGQLLAAIAQPLFMNCPACISATWFPPEERDISTACGSLFSPVGNCIGSIFPVLFVSQTGVSGSGGEVNGMDVLMLVEFILALIPLGLSYVYFKDEPPTAPSHSSAMKAKAITNNLSRRNKDVITMINGIDNVNVDSTSGPASGPTLKLAQSVVQEGGGGGGQNLAQSVVQGGGGGGGGHNHKHNNGNNNINNDIDIDIDNRDEDMDMDMDMDVEGDIIGVYTNTSGTNTSGHSKSEGDVSRSSQSLSTHMNNSNNNNYGRSQSLEDYRTSPTPSEVEMDLVELSSVRDSRDDVMTNPNPNLLIY